ncbi:hypothetical protein TSOC_006318 [Tetrabaena socialis]|uniref:NADH:ubiquinone oxidoreductase intermediate-associated protein 30 domain-containing protein n=1 Tax=Tetrabaena socialis TaxID=47790 RepID=A0A2J8A3X8_9CHLO|nr:hypothetical protein TSOC_006318 [Tetrabaena socialis]|eukprot:PNH07226.1 hypothetical protein TSOC_006318 [Tetrabaena socialis]
MTSVAERLKSAISVGAPVYNSGDVGGCLRTYVSAALEVIEGSTATAGERSLLRDAIERATGADSKDEGAWIMRRAFDTILSGAVALKERAMAAAAAPSAAGDYEVLSFERGVPQTPRWRILDDVIMGGRSQSDGLSYDPVEQAAVFSGRVTTDGGGGFASLRSDDWSGFASFGPARGVRLLVRGDGRTYKLNAKTEADYDGVQYQADFQAPAQKWTQIDLPFSGFKPTFRGRLVPDRPPLQGAAIRSLGLMASKFTASGGVISEFKNGPFRLGIRVIKGFV